MISVFHNDKFKEWKAGQPIDQFDLQMVAQVNTQDLDVAFQKTNSEDMGWWLRRDPNIRVDENALRKNKGFRSTSVGDVLCIAETQQWWVVYFMGFKEVFPFLIDAPKEEE